ncbi:nucleoside-diphosphate kinase [Streptomyces antimycoticus]|uniref:nucleoside-diphosphate kinase n=1 Tax=Streptomyces antimycoticus TaxID=68175 RepID=UPI00343EDD0B
MPLTIPVEFGTGRLGDEIPTWLSIQPLKRKFYGIDLYFREAWEELSTAAGSAEELRGWMHRHAILLCKPDAVVSRQLEAVFGWLTRHDITVVASEIISASRHVIRALWEFQWNIATRDRRDVTELFMTRSPMLVLVVRMPAHPVPAAVRMAALKGSADASVRKPHQLRSSLSTVNYIVNSVHSPDEPADFVRELSVLLDEEQRRRVFQAMLVSPEHPPSADAKQLYEQTRREPPLDYATRRSAWSHAVFAAEREGVIDTDHRRGLTELLAAVEAGKRGWREFPAAMAHAQVPWDAWDTVVLGTTLAEANVPDRFRILSGTSVREWESTADQVAQALGADARRTVPPR